MELLFVFLAGAILGMAARYFLPAHHTHGVILIPSIGAGFASAIWVALTWAGLKWNGSMIWWITLIATGVVVIAVDLLVGRARESADAAQLATLMKTGAPGRS